jgi:hypothetical protein
MLVQIRSSGNSKGPQIAPFMAAGSKCPQITQINTDYARHILLIRRTFPQVRTIRRFHASTISVISVISGPFVPAFSKGPQIAPFMAAGSKCPQITQIAP